MIPARTSVFYIANLGSEVSRLQSALAKGDAESAAGALQRIRMIFGKLSEMPLREGARREVAMLREVIEDLSKQRRQYRVTAESLQDYFLPFAHLVLNPPRS